MTKPTISLLEETIQILAKHGYSTLDILAVIGKDETGNLHSMDVNKFFSIAHRKYDNGDGDHEIDLDLKIIGPNWWLERHEHDESEGWEFKKMPKIPKTNGDVVVFRKDYFK
jgi:hypothetical protein